MISNLDRTIKAYGIKHVFIQSGKLSILSKYEEMGSDVLIPSPLPNYWCELSWTCSHDDSEEYEDYGNKFDAAVAAFGMSFDDAINNCFKDFESLVREGDKDYVEIAKYYNLYDTLMFCAVYP